MIFFISSKNKKTIEEIEDEGWVSYPLAEYVTGEASKLWKAHEEGRCYGLRDGFCDDTGDASKKLLRKVSARVSATVSLHTLIKKYVENIP